MCQCSISLSASQFQYRYLRDVGQRWLTFLRQRQTSELSRSLLLLAVLHTNTHRLTMSSHSVHSSVLYAAHFLLSSQLFHTPSLITYRKLLLIYTSQGSTENTFFTVRSVLDNANSYGLISGVYGTASRDLLLLIYFQQRGFY